MKNVLIVTYHFPPSAASGAFRLLGFARHLPKFGWRTTVVAPPDLPWEPVDRELSRQVPADTTIVEASYPRRAPKILRWAAPYAVWLPVALAACRRALRADAVDAVLTSGPSHWVHLLGLFLKGGYRLPWVADLRDPWVTGRPGLGAERHWQILWEKMMMQHADLILANAPLACAQYQAAYPACASRIKSLTNGYDPDAFPRPLSERLPGPLRIVHAGQIYAGRQPGAFLDALKALDGTQAPGWQATFLGRCSGEGIDVGTEVRQRGLEATVEWGKQVAYDECLRDMSAADALLLLDSPGRRIGVPAKLYEYLGAGRPLLVLAEDDSDTAWVVKESGVVHRIAPPNDAVRIRQALLELGEVVAANRTSAVPTGLARFTREHLAGQLAQSLDTCCGMPNDCLEAHLGPAV